MTATEHVTPLAWMDSAACAELGYGDLWFPGPGDSTVHEALAICATCPVLIECRNWIMNQEGDSSEGYRNGITGGWGARRRANLSRVRGGPALRAGDDDA